MINYEWTPERVEHLKALHAVGKSYTEIAAALGCPTRSVVGGKVMRLRDAGEIGGPRAFQKAAEVTRAGRDRQCPGLAFVPIIKARLDEGKNDREIADECGIRPDDVRYVRRVKGFTASWRPQPLSKAYAEKVKELAEQGRSDNEIAREIGITYYQARSERRRQNIKSRFEQRNPVTTIVKGDPGAKVKAVFSEGFMGQRSRVSLLQLERGMCKFPIDQEDGSTRYCGDTAPDGQPYCAHHAARCYTAAVVKMPEGPLRIRSGRI